MMSSTNDAGGRGPFVMSFVMNCECRRRREAVESRHDQELRALREWNHRRKQGCRGVEVRRLSPIAPHAAIAFSVRVGLAGELIHLEASFLSVVRSPTMGEDDRIT